MIEGIYTDLEQYIGEYESFIDSTPKMLNVASILLKCNINAEERQKICGAITSFIVSSDVLPRELYGPYCYCEQIVAVFSVLREIPLFHVIIEDDIKREFAHAYNKSLEIISPEEKQTILEFYGIREKKARKLADLFE